MELGGQGAARSTAGGESGFAMAALLVGMSIMAVLMSAALPVWNKQAQREREEEYLFRAQQYARAVMKFRQRIANTNPPSVDVLIEQKFLRKKYKDPITGEDFQLVYQTANTGLQPGGPGAATPGQVVPPGAGSSGFGSGPGAGSSSGFGSGQGSSGAGSAGTPTTNPGGTSTSSFGGSATATSGAPGMNAGIIGVVSKSKATSIKIYNGRTRYDQWAVTYQDVKPGKGLPPDLLQAVNATAAGAANPGGNPFGGQGAQPGAAGNPFGGRGGANAPGMPNPFGGGAGAGAPSPFGGRPPGTTPNPFGGSGGFGQPVQPPGGASPGAGSPFSPTYPPPPGGGSLFGAPPKKGP